MRDLVRGRRRHRAPAPGPRRLLPGTPGFSHETAIRKDGPSLGLRGEGLVPTTRRAARFCHGHCFVPGRRSFPVAFHIVTGSPRREAQDQPLSPSQSHERTAPERQTSRTPCSGVPPGREPPHRGCGPGHRRKRAPGNRGLTTAPAQGGKDPEGFQPSSRHRKGCGPLRQEGRVVVGIIHRWEEKGGLQPTVPPQTRAGRGS
jgi:hypothetical protein